MASPMDFLSQVPQALIGRPWAGVSDFASGAIGGLGTGDSGSMSPGLLGTLGRLGMMTLAVRQSKDPTAILKVKSFYDAQDAEKRAALGSPLAQNMTPEEFQQSAGFWAPPQKVEMTGPDGQPIQPGAYTGGRAKVSPIRASVGTGADAREMVQFQSASERLDAAADQSNPYSRRQILDRGFSTEEETAYGTEAFYEFLHNNPQVKPEEYQVVYNPETLVPAIRARDQPLMRRDEMMAQIAGSGIDPKYFQTIERLGGFDFQGNPLYDYNVMNKPGTGRVSNTLPDPIKTAFWSVYNDEMGKTGNATEAMNKASAAAGEVNKKLSISGGPKGDTPTADAAEKEYGIQFKPLDKRRYENLSKSLGKDDSQAKTWAKWGGENYVSVEERMNELVQPYIEDKARKQNEMDITDPNEVAFQQWYKSHAERMGLNPNPDDPQHHYNYRAAFAAGVGPDETGHWPSKFKDKEHPRRVVDFGGQSSTKSQPAPERTPGKKEKVAPKPPAYRFKGVKNLDKDTARDFDKKIEEVGYAPGMIERYATLLKNSDLPKEEQVKVLEGIVLNSKKMTTEEKRMALTRIKRMLGAGD